MAVPCIEVLFITITLWIAVFGIVDELVSLLVDVRDRLVVYCAIGFVGVLMVYLTEGISFCNLQ